MANEKQAPSPSGLGLVMQYLGLAKEDLEAFIAWHARFRIDPDDPIFGLYIAVRASLTSALTAAQGAIDATESARAFPQQLKAAKDELRHAVHGAHKDAEVSLDHAVQHASQKAADVLGQILASKVSTLRAAANHLEHQALQMRERALDEATAGLVAEIKTAALEALQTSTRRSRMLALAAAVVLLFGAAAGGVYVAALTGHVTPYPIARQKNGDLACGEITITGSRHQMVCILNTKSRI